ncbi:hypothetical protein N0V92_013179 [Colletotrichum tropicale]|nr:hypothetical protein N0V92_013179 [Colletotrichum tropicale]
MLDPSTPAASNEQYIAIVNMTPYRFKYLLEHSSIWQVRLDFDDIPPRHFCHRFIEYAMIGDERNDDKAEAYLEVVGTDQRFNIKARSNYDTLNTVNAPSFIDETPSQVTFLWLKETAAFMSAGGGKLFDLKQIEELFAALGKIKNRCHNLEVPDKVGIQFQDVRMGEFMDTNGGKGCALITL